MARRHGGCRNVAIMAEEQICYRCGAHLRQGERRCPECGRAQYRTCYCGAVLRKTAAVCEACGADWSPARRRRTVRKKRPVRGRELVVNALAGALVASVLAAAAGKIVQSLAAAAAANQGIPVPPGLAQQLWLVVVSLAQGVSQAAHDLVARGWQFAGLLVVMLLGAGVGTLLYLGRVGVIRLKRRRRVRKRRR